MTQTAESAQQVLTWREACDFLRIKRTKLYELTRTGAIRRVQYPSATGQRRPLRYERSELQRFIAEHSSVASQ